VSSLGTPALLLIFLAAALVTWVAGVNLAKATDLLDDRYGLGEALGGMILLSVAGSLPELAITVSAAAAGDLGLAAGNLIGGVAMQTLVLVIADRFIRGDRPLSTAAGSLVPALEGLLVIGVVCVTVMSAVLPSSAAIGPVGVGAIGIVVIWLVGIVALNRTRARSDLALVAQGAGGPPLSTVPGGTGPAVTGGAGSPGAGGARSPSTGRPVLVFAVASIVTLIAGVVLERSGNQLASNWGLNGVVFGAAILAAATALPEISTGVTGLRMQRYALVFSDMFGGNAFQLTLFLIADLIAGQPVLPAEGKSNAWIGCIGLLMTAVFVSGIVLRPRRHRLGLGLDSWVALLIYALGIWGLLVVSRG
jgi:cation:H+ antiporter